MEVEGEILQADTDLISRLEFSKEGEQWEASTKTDGSLVVAVDCTQDASTQSSGMCRELITGIQQLRKAANLDLKDIVEVFFQEEDGLKLVEDAVASNVPLFDAKFKGSIPLPTQYAPKWSVPLRSEVVEVGGSSVTVSIRRPSMAVRDDLDESVLLVLSTFEPSSFSEGQSFSFDVDGTKRVLKEGVDFWRTSAEKLRATHVVEWL